MERSSIATSSFDSRQLALARHVMLKIRVSGAQWAVPSESILGNIERGTRRLFCRSGDSDLEVRTVGRPGGVRLPRPIRIFARALA